MKTTIHKAMSSLTAKLAALLFAFTCAGTAWGATVTTEAELRAAIANGGNVTLGADIALTQGEIAVANTVTLDLGTYTLSSPTNVFRVAANGNFTVNADASNPGGISVPTNRCCVYASYGWDPGAKTVVLNGGVFTGNCVFNWAASALSAYVSYENYGLAVDGAGSGEKAVPTSVTINGGTFTGGYELGNVGAYRCYYFTVNGGTFEKGLDCADTRYCSIGVTTTCKAYFNGGRYRDRYPTFRKKTQGLSVVDDPGKVFIGTASHTNSYYIAGGYYVNAYDRSACEVTGTYAGAAVQNSYLIFLTTGYPQRWYNPSATWYFLTEADADDVGATNVIHINEENGSLPQLQTAAASSSAIRLASGKGTLLAASKSAASTEVAPARLLSAVPVRLLSTASATADVITTRPDGTELGEIKVVGNDGHTYITQNASLLSGTVFKTELDADRIDACYFFGPASSPYITENDGSDDETVYAAIHKRVSDAIEIGLFGADDEAATLALMELSFTAEERELLLANAETLASGSDKITEDCFSEKANGTYGLNFEGGGMAVISCVYNNPTLATSDADPFESDPHLDWTLSLVVSFDKAVAADSVRFWWANGLQHGSENINGNGRYVSSIGANVETSISLTTMEEIKYLFSQFLTNAVTNAETRKPTPLLVAVQNLSNANNGTAVKVALRATNPNNSSEYADRASFTHVFGRDTIIAVDPVEGRFKEYNIVDGENVPWGELNRQYNNDKGIPMGIVYSDTRTALETAFNAIENVSETGLENVSIAVDERETQQKWVQIEWHGIVGVRNGYPMTTIAFGIEPLLRSIVADENNEVTSDTTRAITNTELNNQTIKFRLPLTDDYTARALVVHTSDDANFAEERWIANVGGSARARYVEISTKHFSEFTVSPLGADDIVYVTSASGAFIGGYTTLADAYAATEDGGTIYLLQNVSKNIEVSTAKTFNINANGFTYSGAVTAAEGFGIVESTSGASTTYTVFVAVAQIGTTKYETVEAALTDAQVSGATIEILADSTETPDHALEVLMGGNITLTAATPVRVEIAPTAKTSSVDNDGMAYIRSASAAARCTFTVGENVTLAFPATAVGKGAMYIGYSAATPADMVINGRLELYEPYVGSLSKLTVNPSGSIKSISECLIVRWGATVDIVGTGAEWSDANPQAEFGYVWLQGGVTTLKDTYAKGGAWVQTWNRNADKVGQYGDTTLALDNSVLATSKINNQVVIAMDCDSQIVTPVVQNTGSINIDATGITAPFKAIDYTGSGTMALANYGTVNVTGGEAYVEESDLWVKKLPVAQIVTDAGATTTKYATLAAAVADAQSGDTIEMIADVTGENVTVTKSVTITGASDAEGNPAITLENTQLTLSGTMVELAVTNLAFTGSSYINANNGKALTVDHVTAVVDPTKCGNCSRSAFIVLSATEHTTGLDLTVTHSTIVNTSGTDSYGAAIFGWAYLKSATICDNVLGSDSYRFRFIAVKLMNAVDGATYTIERNMVYGTNARYRFYAFDLYQNCSRDNSYTAVSKDNVVDVTATGSYDFFVFDIERNGSVSTKTIVIDSDSTLNGKAVTLNDFRNELNVNAGFYGAGVVYDANGKMTAGTFNRELSDAELEEFVAEGLRSFAVGDGTYTLYVPVAQIGDEKYATLAEAIADAQGGDTILLLADATLDAAVTVSKSLTITLDGHSITGTITAGAGYELVTSDTAYVVRGAGYAGEVLPAGPDMSGDVINVTAANAQYTLDGAYGDINGKTINFTENITERLDLGRCTKYVGSGTTTSGTYPNHTRTLSNVTFTSSEGVTIAGFTANSGHVCSNGDYDYVRDQAVTGTNDGYYKYSSLTGITFKGLTVSDNIFAIYGLEGTICGNITFDGCTFTGNTSDTAPINFNNNGSFRYGDITIQNCTINGSKAGIYINGGAAEYTIKNNYVVAGNNNAIQLWAVVGSAATVDIEGNFLKSDKYTVNLYRFESEQITLTGNAVVAGARGHLGHFQGDASENFWAPQGATPDESGNMTSTLKEPIADTRAEPGENDITSSSYYSTAVVDTSAAQWVTLSNLHTFVAQIGDVKYVTIAAAIEAADAANVDEITILDDSITVSPNPGWYVYGTTLKRDTGRDLWYVAGAKETTYGTYAEALNAANNDATKVFCLWSGSSKTVAEAIAAGSLVVEKHDRFEIEGYTGETAGFLHVKDARGLASLAGFKDYCDANCRPGGSNGKDSADAFYWTDPAKWTVVLDCNIDLDNKAWTTANTGMRSKVDGNGKTVLNLSVNVASGKAGLFTDCGLVSNLKVDGATVSAGNGTAGAVVAWQGGGGIENVIVSNAVVSGKYVGGIVGQAYGRKYTGNVLGNVSVTTTTKYVGGIAGQFYVDGNTLYEVDVQSNVLNDIQIAYSDPNEIYGSVLGALISASAPYVITDNAANNITTNGTLAVRWDNDTSDAYNALWAPRRPDDTTHALNPNVTYANNALTPHYLSQFVYPIEGTAGVPVASEWLAAQFPSIYPDATKPILASITNDLLTALSENGANNMPKWESYVLGLNPADPTAVLRLTATAKNATTVTVTGSIDTTKFPSISNVTVTFRLAAQNGAEWTDIATGAASPSFDVSLDDVAGKVLTIFADIVTK